MFVPPPAVFAATSEVQRCHLHTKPLLSCKFCRKYKMAVHHQAKIAQLNKSSDFKQDALEMNNTVTYNMNAILRENILSSEYFKSLYAYETLQDIIGEIVEYVDHAEPYCTGHARAPSTFICCLYKLFTMKLTEDELLTLIENSNVFVRAVGFLWLRFVHPPEKLWPWFENVLLDDEMFNPSADHSPHNLIGFGQFLQKLLTEDRYFQTVLPRLPAKIRQHYGLQLTTLPEHAARKRRNKANLYKLRRGVEVMACYKSAWRYGVFTGFYEDDVTRQKCAFVKFSDPECADEDQVLIDLGLIIVLSKRHKQKRFQQEKEETTPKETTESPDKRSADVTDNLYAEYKKKERERALATGKDYAKRPSSYKASLSVKIGTSGKSSPVHAKEDGADDA